MDLAPNGELFSIIQREGKLKHELIQFLSAEIINILKYMHSKGISHRDLKPSNLLFDENYHLKVCDFGCSKLEEVKKQQPLANQKLRASICIEMDAQGNKIVTNSQGENNIEEHFNQSKTTQATAEQVENEQIQKKATLVGTEDYISPEILTQESSGMPADLWSLGVIIFMMICGRSPFKSPNQITTFNNITNVQF